VARRFRWLAWKSAGRESALVPAGAGTGLRNSRLHTRTQRRGRQGLLSGAPVPEHQLGEPVVAACSGDLSLQPHLYPGGAFELFDQVAGHALGQCVAPDSKVTLRADWAK